VALVDETGNALFGRYSNRVGGGSAGEAAGEEGARNFDPRRNARSAAIISESKVLVRCSEQLQLEQARPSASSSLQVARRLVLDRLHACLSVGPRAVT